MATPKSFWQSLVDFFSSFLYPDNRSTPLDGRRVG